MISTRWLAQVAAGLGLALLAGLAPAVHAEPAGPARTGYPGGRWEPPAATFGVAATRHVPVQMSDGATLIADVYRPADPVTGLPAPGEFPVLLTRTPYSGSIGAAGLASEDGPGDYFVQRGYVYVSVDVRGTGRSVGPGEFFGRRDALDGVELVSWVADLPGVDGTVGLHGCSYLGHTQLYTAALLGPDSPVEAMIPACSGSDPYRTTYMENGIHAPAWEGAGLLAGALLGPGIEAFMVPKYLESQAGGDTAYDGEFWAERDHVRHAEAIAATGIPTLLWNGWDDSGFGGLELFTALQHASFGRPPFGPLRAKQAVTGRIQLLLGEWTHGGGLDEGIQLQWYETWLKGARTGLATNTRTPLHVQDRVTGRWSNVAAFPLAATYTSLHLAEDRLDPGPSPAPSSQSLAWVPPDQEDGSLTYTGAPLQEGATVAGPGAVRLHAASSGTDLQLMADVYDVAPDGTATLVTRGGILGSLAAVDPERSWYDDDGLPARPHLLLRGEELVAPGAVRAYDVPLQPTLWSVAPGHRLRLRVSALADPVRCFEKAAAITTSVVGCRPRAAVAARLAGSTFTLHHGGGHPSLLSLPLLSFGSLPEARSGVTPTSDRALPLDW